MAKTEKGHGNGGIVLQCNDRSIFIRYTSA